MVWVVTALAGLLKVTVAYMWFTVATMAYSQVQAKRQRDKIKAQQAAAEEEADKQKGFQFNTESDVMNVPVVYGRSKIGGNRVFHRTADSFTFTPVDTNTSTFTTSGSVYSRYNTFTIPGTSTLSALAIRMLDVTFDGEAGYGGFMNLSYAYWYIIAYAGPDYASGDYFSAEDLEDSIIGNTITRDNQGTLSVTVQTGRAALFPIGRQITLYHPPFDDDVGPWEDVITKEMTFTPTVIASLCKISGYSAGSGALTVVPATVEQPAAGMFPYSHSRRGWMNSALSSNQTGTKKEFLFFNQVLSYRGLSAVNYVDINDLDFDDDEYGSSGRISVHREGGPSTLMHTNFPTIADGVTHNSQFQNVAYAACVFKIDRDDPQYHGPPNVTYYVKGIAVYGVDDNDGEGYTLTALKEYSNNAALVLLDYLTNSKYGGGLDINKVDLESFYLAQEICGKLVEVNGSTVLPKEGKLWSKEVGDRTLQRYEFNGVLDTGNSIRTNVEKILSAMSHARLFWSNGMYSLRLLYPEIWTAGSWNEGDIVQHIYGANQINLFRANKTTTDEPGVTSDWEDDWDIGPDQQLVAAYLTDDDIIINETINIAWPDLSDRYNFCTVEFLNESKDFEKDSASWPDKYDADGPYLTTYIDEDNGLQLETTASPAGVTNIHHAKAYAEEVVRRSRNSHSLVLSLSKDFLYLEPGDVLHVQSNELEINSILYMIDELTVTKDSLLELKLTVFDARTFAWNAPDDEVVPARSVWNSLVPQVKNLTYSQPSETMIGLTAGRLSWEAPAGIAVKHYAIYMTDGVAAEDQNLGTTVDTYYDLPILAAGRYIAAVQTVSVSGHAPRIHARTGSEWPSVGFEVGSNTFNDGTVGDRNQAFFEPKFRLPENTGVLGCLDEAFNFDSAANDYGMADDNEAIKPSEISVSFCSRHTTTEVSTILQSASANPEIGGWRIETQADGKIRVYIGSNTGTVLNTDWAFAESISAVNTGENSRFGFKYDGANIKVYVDGILEDTVAYAGGLDYADTNYIRMACRNDEGYDSSFFDGYLDEIKVYDRGLADFEFGALAGLPDTFMSTKVASLPEWYWKLDEITGTVALDSMGNHNLTYSIDAGTAGFDAASTLADGTGRAKTQSNLQTISAASISDVTLTTDFTMEFAISAGTLLEGGSLLLGGGLGNSWMLVAEVFEDGEVELGFATGNIGFHLIGVLFDFETAYISLVCDKTGTGLLTFEVNGENTDSIDISSTAVDWTGDLDAPFSIFNSSFGDLDLTLDEVSIHTEAITAAERTAFYSRWSPNH